MGVSAIFVVCGLLIITEVVYLFLLDENKSKLGLATAKPQTPKGNVLSDIFELLQSISRHWQLKALSAMGVFFLIGLLGLGLFNVLRGMDLLPERVNIVTLKERGNEKGGKTYTFKIPDPYYMFGAVRAEYPRTSSPSGQNKLGYYNPKTSNPNDVVKIYIHNANSSTFVEKDIKYPNDLGRVFLERILRDREITKQVPITESMEEVEKIVKYKSEKRERFVEAEQFVITHEDRRISVITCHTGKNCTGWTTWKGLLGISYEKKNMDRNKMVDLDRSVVALVDSFKPELVISTGETGP